MKTTEWMRTLNIGRWTVYLRLLRHRYSDPSPDRWVVESTVIYDRKARS